MSRSNRTQLGLGIVLILLGVWFFAQRSWLLVPGFVGAGNIIRGLLGEDTRNSLAHGLNLMVVSAVLFLVFSAFFGGWDLLGNYSPSILLILLGLWVSGKRLYSSIRRKGGRRPCAAITCSGAAC